MIMRNANILVTGSKGFIGTNLIVELRSQGYDNILEYDLNSDPIQLEKYCQKAEFIFHLAGVNRPKNPAEFQKGNYGFTLTILEMLEKHQNSCPIMLASSVQADMNNPYGRSKLAGEKLLLDFKEKMGTPILIYRFPNVFGKWSKPNYNSAVATFCYNVARSIPIEVHDPDQSISLVYIDDLIDEMLYVLEGSRHPVEDDYYSVPTVYKCTVGKIARLIKTFAANREQCKVANLADELEKKIYSTYLSFLPKDEFSYELKMNKDDRGSFTEFIKTEERGQFSVNISKPNIVKGNHWHHTKTEKFLVVSGEAVIRFRKVNEDEILEYHVNGDKLTVVDIPPGYTHNIENTGSTELVTIMWANENYDPEKPDTKYLKV